MLKNNFFRFLLGFLTTLLFISCTSNQPTQLEKTNNYIQQNLTPSSLPFIVNTDLNKKTPELQNKKLSVLSYPTLDILKYSTKGANIAVAVKNYITGQPISDAEVKIDTPFGNWYGLYIPQYNLNYYIFDDVPLGTHPIHAKLPTYITANGKVNVAKDGMLINLLTYLVPAGTKSGGTVGGEFATLKALKISAPLSVKVHKTIPLSVTGIMSDGNTMENPIVKWSVSDSRLATIDARQGPALLTANSIGGEVTVTVEADSVIASTKINILPIIGSEGGEVCSYDGKACVNIPPNALSEEKNITINPVPPEQTPEGAIGNAYDFGPGGLQFQKSVDVAITYDPTLIPSGIKEESLALCILENLEGVRVPEAGVDTNKKVVFGKLSHFTVAFPGSSPILTSIVPNTASAGTTIRINGDFFVADAGKNRVSFGGLAVISAINAAADGTWIEVIVPTVTPGLMNIRVRRIPPPAPPGNWSNTLTFCLTPDIPTGLTATNITQNSFTLLWTAVTGATEYKIYKDGILETTVPASTTTVDITGLNPGTTYSMTVSSAIACGESPQSAPLNVTTLPAGPPTICGVGQKIPGVSYLYADCGYTSETPPRQFCTYHLSDGSEILYFEGFYPLWTGHLQVGGCVIPNTYVQKVILQIRGSDVYTYGYEPSAGNCITLFGDPTHIDTINPNSGPVGTVITINGANFDVPSENNVVQFFGGATVNAQPGGTTTQITAIAPTGATTGGVKVKAKGCWSNEVNFTVTIVGPNWRVNPWQAIPNVYVDWVSWNYHSIYKFWYGGVHYTDGSTGWYFPCPCLPPNDPMRYGVQVLTGGGCVIPNDLAYRIFIYSGYPSKGVPVYLYSAPDNYILVYNPPQPCPLSLSGEGEPSIYPSPEPDSLKIILPEIIPSPYPSILPTLPPFLP